MQLVVYAPRIVYVTRYHHREGTYYPVMYIYQRLTTLACAVSGLWTWLRVLYAQTMGPGQIVGQVTIIEALS